MATGDLFNPKTIQRLCEDVKISSKQKQSAKEWLALLDENKLQDEKSNYPKFMQIILQDILGYPIKELDYESGNVEFQFGNSEGKNILCFEAKGTGTKDLFAPQHRAKKEHETPIKQTWDYMGSIGLDYGICTNYKDFVLITKQFGYSKYHFFDFNSVKKNEEKLKEFVGIFSKERIIEKGFVEKLHKESVVEEREFTKEFYKLFHETRLMMVKAFEEKENVSRTEAVYYTQLFLNRLIFIFFVEDKGFIPNKQLFSDRILHLLESGQFTEHSRKIFDDIKELFIAFDKGSRVLGVFGFNGSLFSGITPEKVYFSDIKDAKFFEEVKQYSKLSKSTKLNEKTSRIIKKHPDLNPIISNLLIMDSFDFNTEVNVNILGHVFEQSISDLEEINRNKSLRRKKEGVYYTPSKLTEFICKNTIIPYLSKSGASSIPELIKEYEGNLDELETKFRKIKILDPACGSGAFLVKAVDILMELYKEIQERKDNKNHSNGQLQMTHEWDENKEIRAIIENNIYGVDINSESIDITKLSLFLKLASNERKLIGLSQNIKAGNSLIDDKTVDERSFSWEDEFPEILGKLIEDKGFDIIIGNPPWQIVKPSIDEFYASIYENENENEKFSLLNKVKKNRFIQKALEDPEIVKTWNEYEESYKKQMNFFNNSGDYKHQVSIVNGKKNASDLNLYKLFIEKSSKLLKTNGICGLVIPAGIYSDLGAKGLRELIFKENNMKMLISFVNNGIFEDVHYQFKFCIIIFEKNINRKKFSTRFNEKNLDILQKFDDESFDYDLELIDKSAPNSLSLLECSTEQEELILKKMYQFPLLQNKEVWNIKAKSEFHLTGDSNLFHTSKIGYPLFEGKMIHQFKNDLAKPRYWIDEKDGITVLQKKEIARMKKIIKEDNSSITPQLDCNQYRLVWRDITNATNERGMITTILPPNVFLGNTLNYIVPIYFDGKKYNQTLSTKKLLYLCGVLNSFPLDFILRHKISSHANIFYVKELPVPEFIPNDPIHEKISENTAKLICTTEEFTSLKNELNVKSVTDFEERQTLIAQINAMTSKIYKLDKSDLEIILESFPIVDSKLKELVLDEYDYLK